MRIANKNEIKEICKKYAEKYELDWVLIYAIAKVENCNNEPLLRFEPNFYEKYIKKLKLEENEKFLRSCSYGQMQIMGQTAIECGWNEPLIELMDTEKNIELACKFIKILFEKYKNEEYVISAYNGGLRRNTENMTYSIVNDAYVNKVYRWINNIKRTEG